MKRATLLLMRCWLAALLFCVACRAQTSNVITLTQGPLTCGSRVFKSGTYAAQLQWWCYRLLSVTDVAALQIALQLAGVNGVTIPPGNLLAQNTIQNIVLGSALLSFIDIPSHAEILVIAWNDPATGFRLDWTAMQSLAGGKSGREIFKFP